MYALFPPYKVVKAFVHRLSFGNWYCKGYIWIHREFDTWLLAKLDQIIDGCLIDEPRTWLYVKKLVLSGRVNSILDIGAHIGAYSVVLCKKIFGVAIEPMPDTFTILKFNAIVNNSNVRAIRRAVWSETNKLIRLQRSIQHSGSDFVSNDGDVEADTVCVDDLWTLFGPFDLVKIDAEGSEDRILLGFSPNKISLNKKMYIIIEVRPKTINFCLRWLKQNSFRVIFTEKLIRSNRVVNIVAETP
jgi:FkbM family methyltransferase